MKNITTDTFRMVNWLLISIALYTIAALLARYELLPQAQTILWKFGHIVSAAFVGYRIDRAAFRDRITADSMPQVQIRRAIIIGASMLAIAMGL